MISRGTVYPITTETPARVLAHLVYIPADLTGCALVNVCKHTWKTIKYVTARGAIVTANDVVIARDRGDCRSVHAPVTRADAPDPRQTGQVQIARQLRNEIGRTRASLAKLRDTMIHVKEFSLFISPIRSR